METFVYFPSPKEKGGAGLQNKSAAASMPRRF